MFEIGDYVVNATNGICRIQEVVQMDLSGSRQPKDYFLLIPIEEKTAKIYIPLDIAEKRIRPVIGEQEAWNIIRKIPDIQEAWIDNDKEREKKYKEVLSSCDLEKLIGIIKNMYHRREERTSQGKKSTAIDERYFKLAENHLYTELAFALGKDQKDMQEFIKENMKTIEIIG